MALSDEKYVSVSTFRKTGVAVATPTWIVPIEGGRVGFWTSSASGKAKRLRNNAKLTLQPSDARGRPTAPAVWSGTAELMEAGPEFDAVQREVRAKYGAMVPVSRLFNRIGHFGKAFPYGDIAVIVTLSGESAEPGPSSPA